MLEPKLKAVVNIPKTFHLFEARIFHDFLNVCLARPGCYNFAELLHGGPFQKAQIILKSLSASVPGVKKKKNLLEQILTFLFQRILRWPKDSLILVRNEMRCLPSNFCLAKIEH